MRWHLHGSCDSSYCDRGGIESLAGCAREPKSAIVQKVEAAGSGDLSQVSNAGIRNGSGHKDLRTRWMKCASPSGRSAAAGWSDSTEGRVCNTARELAFSDRGR